MSEVKVYTAAQACCISTSTEVILKSDYDLLQAKLAKAVEALKKLSKTGDGTDPSKKASFYDCLPTLQIEFSERIELARQTLKEIEVE